MREGHGKGEAGPLSPLPLLSPSPLAALSPIINPVSRSASCTKSAVTRHHSYDQNCWQYLVTRSACTGTLRFTMLILRHSELTKIFGSHTSKMHRRIVSPILKHKRMDYSSTTVVLSMVYKYSRNIGNSGPWAASGTTRCIRYTHCKTRLTA